MRRGRIFVAVLSCALLLGSATLAEAKSVETGEPADGRATAVAEQPDGARLHCYGQTDRPHRSVHQGGTVNVVARSVCRGSSEWVFVSTELYRDRWYGPQFLDDGRNSGYGSTSTNAAWRCAGVGTYTYRAYSYHDFASSLPVRTSNSDRFAC